MAGLVPAISLRRAQCFLKRDSRVKPANDVMKNKVFHDVTFIGLTFS